MTIPDYEISRLLMENMRLKKALIKKGTITQSDINRENI